MITLSLLEALLSSNGQQRQAAEAHLQSLDVNQRVFGWPVVWQQVEQAVVEPQLNTALPHMIAVLWRRDILTCSTNVATLLEPLQQIFASDSKLVVDDKIRSAIGYCLAEVVALLHTSAALEQTLQATQVMFSTNPGPVLELYQALGRALPADFWTPPVVAWMLDQIQRLMPPTATSSFTSAGALAQSSQRAVQVLDTLVALAPDQSNLPRIEAILQPWLATATDVDTLSHFIQNAGTHFGQLSDAFWQRAWQQVQPHASSEPRLVCQALEQLVHVLKQDTQILEAMQMLLGILSHAVDEDTEEWSAVEWLEEDAYEVDHDEEGLAAYAIDVLNLWLVTHEKQLPAVVDMIQSTDGSNWRALWTTLTAWQCCLTALPVALEAQAPAFFHGLCSLIVSGTNQHVRVRHQAWQTFAGFVEIYPHVVSDKDGLAQAIRQGLLDGHPRVTAVVCRVITSLALTKDDKEEEEPVWNHGQLDFILQGLASGPLSPQAPCRLVVLRALKAVASLAASAPLGSFLDPIMRLLRDWAEREASVTGEALEAAALVAQSLAEDEGVIDRVRAESSQLMERLGQLLQQGGANVEKELLLSACARLATVLEDDFQPYLPMVLGLLLEKVNAKDDIEFSEGDSAGLDQTRRGELEDNTFTMHVPGKGLTRVSIHTSQIEEKTKAIRALYTLLTSIPSAWAPFFEATWTALDPLLNYIYHADIRTTAAQSVAALIEAGLLSGQNAVWSLFPKAAVTVSKQLTNEANAEAEDLYALADSLSEMLYSVFSRKNEHQTELLQNYTTQVADQVVLYCGQALQKCLERRTVTAVNISKNSSRDEQAAGHRQLEDEQKLMTPLVDSIGYSLKILGPSFSSIFEQKVVPLLGPFLQPNVDNRARWSAICLFDDCVEHCGPQAASRFAPQLLPSVVSGMDESEVSDLRQVSIYGIAQIARYAPGAIDSNVAGSIIPALATIARQPKDSFDNVSIQENAVSALVSLVLFPDAPYRGKFVKAETATKILLENMPLTMDYDEAKICSTGLCDLVESAAIPLRDYTRELVEVIGATLGEVSKGEEVATEADCARMSAILMQLQQDGSVKDFQEAFYNLPLESQAAVQSVMQKYSNGCRRVVVTP